MKDFPKVAAIILNYNCADATISCAESLLKAKYPVLDIIVVDNSSQKPDRTLLEKLESKILKVIYNPENGGYSAGNNIGIRYALEKVNPEYILIINPDIKVSETFLIELVRAAEKWPTIGICAPVQLYSNKPDVVYSAGGRLWWFLGQQQMILSGKPVGKLYKAPSEVDFVSGGCMLIRKELLQKAMLPEEYFLQWEDMDFCKQAQQLGYKIAVVPQSIIWHKIGLTIKKGPRIYDMVYRGIRNRFIFFLKYTKQPGAKIFWICCFCSSTYPTYVLHSIIMRRDLRRAKSLTWGLIEGLTEYSKKHA